MRRYGRTTGQRSRRSLRRILPEADFGIASTNSTWRTFLYGATLLGDEAHDLWRCQGVGPGRDGLSYHERLRYLFAAGSGPPPR